MKRLILLAILILMTPSLVLAQDELLPLSGCTDSRAVNYLNPSEWVGFQTIDDGSCAYLSCDNTGACWGTDNPSEANYDNFIANYDAITSGIPVAIDNPEVAEQLMTHDFSAWLEYLLTYYEVT